ncbi:PLD nuclease N-terminal domain-containing protein [Streptosporangium sp. NPDC087985]|uniref:PLD nuclease N-terminal domain-containing protein n=1 Tax=Streptosporangium sp. NPDC087985 TaxID=3366196 RepID=UPI003815B4EB
MPLLVALALLAFWLYCLFDAITTPDEQSRNLPKLVWVIIIVLLPPFGGLFWLLLGRPFGPQEPRAFPPQERQARPRAPKGPDDDPDFLKDLDRRLRDDE